MNSTFGVNKILPNLVNSANDRESVDWVADGEYINEGTPEYLALFRC